jgi:hypothetical protein
MSPAEVSNAIQNLALFSAIRESALAYPIILASHLSSIALFGGTILMTDLRLLGVAMTGQPPSDVIGQFRIWKWIGFVVMAASGILLAAPKPKRIMETRTFNGSSPCSPWWARMRWSSRAGCTGMRRNSTRLYRRLG